MMRPVAVAVLLVALPAAAQQIKTAEELERIRAASRPTPTGWTRPTYSIAPKVGIGFGEMWPAYAVAFDVGYAPPVLEKQLLLAIEASWKRPSGPGTGSYQVSVDELAAAAVASFRAYPATRFGPYVGVGAGLCATRAVSTFSPALSRTEKELRVTLFALGGMQFLIGTGALEVEFRLTRSPSDLPVLRGSSIVPYSVTAGYRFSL